MEFKGLYTAIITPFGPQGNLDEEGLRENLTFQLEGKVDGIVVLGTTGETPTLTHEEQERVIDIALEEVKGKALLMVGTGSYSTKQTIAMTRFAQEKKADAALIVTPYYNKPTQEGIFKHFSAICEAVSLPICLYNIQGRTAQNIQTETLERLISLPSIKGVKEASGNIIQMTEVLEKIKQQRPDFSVLSGDDILTFPLMALGGDGVISVVSNLIPHPMHQFIQAALEEKWTLAREWHYQLLPLFRAIFLETNPIPIKKAMELWGMAAGSCRLPLCDLSNGNAEKLQQVLSTLPASWRSSLSRQNSVN